MHTTTKACGSRLRYSPEQKPNFLPIIGDPVGHFIRIHVYAIIGVYVLDVYAMIGEYVLGTRLFEGTCLVRASQESAASLEVGVEGPPARSCLSGHVIGSRDRQSRDPTQRSARRARGRKGGGF